MSEKTKVEDINRKIYDIKNAYQDKKREVPQNDTPL